MRRWVQTFHWSCMCDAKTSFIAIKRLCMKISWDYMTCIYMSQDHTFIIESVYLEHNSYIIDVVGVNKYLLLLTPF